MNSYYTTLTNRSRENNMICDKCGKDTKNLVRVISEHDVESGMSSRGTEAIKEPLPVDQQWCISCVNQQ